MTFARLPCSPRGRLRAVAHVAMLAGLAALAACASPPSRFYTLGNDSVPATMRSAANPALLIEVPPVDVPPQVAKNQFVVQTGPTQVQVLEQERWASLPGDEIRRALSTSLTQQLGTLDVYGTAYPDSTPVYRVSMNVQRFESWPGSHALIDAVWSVRAVRSAAVLTCRSVVSQPVTGGSYDSLVDGHRQALQQISTQIAAAVRMLAAAPGARTGTPAEGASAAPSGMPAAALRCPAAPAPAPASPAPGAAVNGAGNVPPG